MLKSFDARLDKLEQHLARSTGPSSLSDTTHEFLTGEIILINFVTPISKIYSPLMNKYRKEWGEEIWTNYLKKSVSNFGKNSVSKWWKALTAEQQYYLIHGEEEDKSN